MRRRTTKRRLSIGWLALALAVPSAAKGEDLSLDQAIALALRDNPVLSAARKGVEIAAARVGGAYGVEDPRLEFEYNRLIADRMLTGDPMRMLSLSQDLPFPTKLFARRAVAARSEEIARQTLRAKERELVAGVKSSFGELALTEESLRILEEARGVLAALSSHAAARYASGEASQADALRAQVESARVEKDLIMLAQQRTVARAQLNLLLNRPPDQETTAAPAELSSLIAPPLADLYAAARRHNPELAAAEAAAEKARSAASLARQEYLPDIMLKFTKGVGDQDWESGEWAGMVGISLPLWFFQKQAPMVREARAEEAMADAEYRSLENEVRARVREAHARLEGNRSLYELYRSSFIPQAEGAVSAARAAYQAGKADISLLLDGQRMLLEFRRDGIAAAVAGIAARADLEQAAGIDLKEIAGEGNPGEQPQDNP